MKLLLSAYACEPDRGSEPGVGWHWVLELNRLGHDVWVLTRANNQDAIQRASPNLPHVRFIYYDLPQWLATLKKKAPILQFYYLLWQWGAYRAARELHRQEQFDLVQHLTFGVFRHPSFMGRLGIPFIFGPVGGGERVPFRLRMDYGVKGYVVDAARDLANVVARWNPWLHETLGAAHVILAKTPHTGMALPRQYHHKVRHALEIGVSATAASPQPVPHDGGIKFLFVGRFLYWKGMQYGLRALARLLYDVPNARLTMVGGGPEGPRWRRLCETLGIAHAVEWNGWMQQSELASVYRSHDVLLFPSLHDSSGGVVLDAMSHGLPVVCFDLGGPGVLVTGNSGIAVTTAGRDRQQLVAALSEAMKVLAEQPDTLRAMQLGALARARELTWATVVSQVYGETADGPVRLPELHGPELPIS
jgi:glycosyltransferase involved in cell wall biosynthesis